MKSNTDLIATRQCEGWVSHAKQIKIFQWRWRDRVEWSTYIEELEN